MKSKIANLSLCICTALALSSCDNSPRVKSIDSNKAAPENNSDVTTSANPDLKKISQALGNFIGRNLNTPGINFDLESIIQGIRDGAAGKPSPMTDQEYEKAMGQLQQQAMAAVSKKNLDAAESFMKDNAKATGVVEIIPEKLQYMILEEGQGETVKEHSTPQITYVGKYIDGTVFGDSNAAGGPISVPLDQTIPGFSKGILGMKEGEKRRLFVHPEVGYGTSGQLLPNSLLIFDIQVIKASSDDKDSAEAFHGDANDGNEGGEQSGTDQGNPN